MKGAPKMRVPKPRFAVWTYVWSNHFGVGIITWREYDNLLHAKEWRYWITWLGGKKRTKHHYCHDLRKATDEEQVAAKFLMDELRRSGSARD